MSDVNDTGPELAHWTDSAPLPWTVGDTEHLDSGDRRIEIVDANGCTIATVSVSSDEDGSAAARIVACVNACKGLKTEWLEQIVSDGRTLDDEARRLKAEGAPCHS